MDSVYSSNPRFDSELAIHDGKSEAGHDTEQDPVDFLKPKSSTSRKVRLVMMVCVAAAVGLVGGVFIPTPIGHQGSSANDNTTDVVDVHGNPSSLVDEQRVGDEWVEFAQAEDTLQVKENCQDDDDYMSLPVAKGITDVGAAINIRTGLRTNIFKTNTFKHCKLCADVVHRCPDIISQWTKRPRQLKHESNSKTVSGATFARETSEKVERSLGLNLSAGEANKISIAYAASTQTDWTVQQSRKSSTEFKHLWDLIQLIQFDIGTSDLDVNELALEGLRKVAQAGTKEAAAEFLDRFGSHIIISEPLGGYREVVYSLKSKEYKYATEKNIVSHDCLEYEITKEYSGVNGKLTDKRCRDSAENEKVSKILSNVKEETNPLSFPPFATDPNNVWYEKMENNPVPIGPMLSNRIASDFRTEPMAKIVDMMNKDQLAQVDPHGKLKKLLEDGFIEYGNFLSTSHCSCKNGGVPMIKQPYTPGTQPKCECACESGFSGIDCADPDPDHLTFFRENCYFNFVQFDNSKRPTVRTMSIKPDSGRYDKLEVLGTMDGNDMLYFNIECSCPTPCTGTRKAAYDDILLGLAFYVGQADSYSVIPLSNHATGVNRDVYLSGGRCGTRKCCYLDKPAGIKYADCIPISGEVDKNDRLFFAVPKRRPRIAAYQKQGDRAMENLKGCTLTVGHSDIRRWTAPDRKAAVSFGGQKCGQLGGNGECRSINVCTEPYRWDAADCVKVEAAVLPTPARVDSNDAFFGRIDCEWGGLDL